MLTKLAEAVEGAEDWATAMPNVAVMKHDKKKNLFTMG